MGWGVVIGNPMLVPSVPSGTKSMLSRRAVEGTLLVVTHGNMLVSMRRDLVGMKGLLRLCVASSPAR